MKKNLSYETPDMEVESFVCEEGVFDSSYEVEDAEDGGFSDTF